MNEKPRAFEPRRLLRALRAHYPVLLGVVLLALFGGAVVGRLAVPKKQLARAIARIAQEPHAVFARALEADVLERALRRAGDTVPLSWLRESTRIGFEGPDRLTVEVRASVSDGRRAQRLADALVETYVALANERLEQDSFASRRERDSQRERARAEHDQRAHALALALAREGAPELMQEQARVRTELGLLEQEASAASLAASTEQERVSARQELTPPKPTPFSAHALSQAQRELSRKLLLGAPEAELRALRARLRRLQAKPARADDPRALEREVDVRAQAVRARGLAQRVTQKRAELARLAAIGQRVAPLVALEQTAHTRLLEREAEAQGVRAALPRSSVLQHAELELVEQHGLRWLISLLAPTIALLTLAVFYLLHQLPELRVREATELAHWLAVPVLASSAWPGRADALERLVDQLADPALTALGVTLLLPLTELERPLAATLVAQLNARAQRHYRSLTGSRVTIAQDWQGELDSPRIARAAEAADRVLWVVVADAHHGDTLAQRRLLVAHNPRVAAVLVDAEAGTSRSVGSAEAFWRTPAKTYEPPVELPRVPLH